MIARPMTKGGVMIGSTVSARRILPYLKPVRVTTSANTSPIAVVSRPTTIARNSEFQATPQRVPPVTQPVPHSLSLNSLARKVDSE